MLFRRSDEQKTSDFPRAIDALPLQNFGKIKLRFLTVSIHLSKSQKYILNWRGTKFHPTTSEVPHGLDFIDDENIIVANREGEPCIFDLPLGATGNYELEPLAVIRSDKILIPGSCAVIVRSEQGLYEALICNNYANRVTPHLIRFRRRIFDEKR